MGVFATRSPFRPNPLGLSCVEIDHIEYDTSEGPVIYVRGADLMDGTPVYDIKPYIRYADSCPDAVCGYVDNLSESALKVNISDALSEEWREKIDLGALTQVLELDPRPSYQNDPDREYGMRFGDYEIFFRVSGDLLTVTRVEEAK